MLEPQVLGWLHRHHGVASQTELIELGLSDDQIFRLRRRGTLETPHRGVYRLAGMPVSLEGIARGACLADADAVVGDLVAGRWWGYRRLPRPTDRVRVLVPYGNPGPKGDRIEVRRTTSLEPEDIVDWSPGIRVTSPPRTVFDLAAHLDDAAVESVIEQALDRNCTLDTLWRTGHRLVGRGRTGSERFVRVLSARAAWQKPADSDLELRVLRALERRGIVLVRQHRLETALGPIHLDGADVAIRWGVEVDHVTWHGGRLDAQHDKARDRAATLIGWQVHRVSDAELDDRFDAVIDDLVALHAERARQ